ncbi:MAG: YicC/YloC family endoribonuclease [Desulfatirhabdiaceae bacterium]
MIQSMTAFARVEQTSDVCSVVCEIRSCNSRNLDLVLRMPSGLLQMEEKLKAIISTRLNRGRVEVHLQTAEPACRTSGFVVDETIADAYYQALDQLKNRFNLEGPMTIELLAGCAGVIRPADPVLNRDSYWPTVETSVLNALDSLCAMRLREGETLYSDLFNRLQMVGTQMACIENESDGLLESIQKRLLERIRLLTEGRVDIDQARLAQEAAYLADRSDISEELVRMNGHIQQFQEIMDAMEPGGRKLNFLLQEMLREINTIGSKTEKIGISHRVVAVKAELEKLREQVQNIE